MFIFYNAITGGGCNMKIYKSYKFRMYPNKFQEELINKTIGSCRFIYNHFLDKKVSNAYSGIKLK